MTATADYVDRSIMWTVRCGMAGVKERALARLHEPDFKIQRYRADVSEILCVRSV